jgi:HEAT repeat protein
MPELLVSLSDSDYRVRLVAIAALRNMGTAAEPAVPALIVTLTDDVSDVRVVSAEALGAIGSRASPAVPALINALRSDDHGAVRASAAEALGKIGDACSVPILAEILQEPRSNENLSIQIEIAQAIARLTHNQFPNAEPGLHGYKLNEEGEPIIVVAAQEWWQEEGKFRYWGECSN